MYVSKYVYIYIHTYVCVCACVCVCLCVCICTCVYLLHIEQNDCNILMSQGFNEVILKPIERTAGKHAQNCRI